MSDLSQGPGWWEATDGKWYAPELHPDAEPPDPQPLAAESPAVPLPAPDDAQVAAAAEETPQAPESLDPSSPRRSPGGVWGAFRGSPIWLQLGLSALLVLVVIAAVVNLTARQTSRSSIDQTAAQRSPASTAVTTTVAKPTTVVTPTTVVPAATVPTTVVPPATEPNNVVPPASGQAPEVPVATAAPRGRNQVASLNGTADQNGDEFHLDGGPTQIIYASEADDFEVYLVDAANPETGSGHRMVTCVEFCDDYVEVGAPQGDYFLDVRGTGSWTVTVEEMG